MVKRTRGDKKGNVKEKEAGISRDEFIDALTMIQPAVTKGELVEQSEQVLMVGDRLISYDDELAISYPFDIGLNGAVFQKELLKLLKKLPKQSVLEISDNGSQVIIVAGNVEAGFNIARDIPIPNLGLDEVVEWFPIPNNFIKGLEICLSSAASDPTRGILNFINATASKIISCDNYRATLFDLAEPLPDGVDIKIHHGAAKVIGKYEPTEFGLSKSWTHFRNEKALTFSCRRPVDDYPNVLGLFNTDGEEVEFPSALIEALSRVEIMAEEDKKNVRRKAVVIKIDRDQILCKAESDKGYIKETTIFKSREAKPEFSISPEMFKTVLERLQRATISERVVVFEGEGVSYAVAMIADQNTGETEDV